MAITQQSATWTSLGNNIFQIDIGATSMQFDYSQIKNLFLGNTEDINLLLMQAIVFLKEAGTNINNIGAVGALLNSKTYWWHP